MISPRLDELLYVTDSDDGEFQASRAEPANGYTIKFTAGFTGAPNAHGIKVDPDSGEVTVLQGWETAPEPRLRTFIVTATATRDGGTATSYLRIYVHASTSFLWLSPSSLTVRQNAKNMRFSVLARFDDAVVGDISNWSPLNAPTSGELDFVRHISTNDPVLQWGPREGDSPSVIHVDPVTGDITNEGDPDAQVKVEVFYNLGNPLASAMVRGAPSWDTGVNLKFIKGNGGFASMFRDDMHNVLFLPEGFVDDAGGADRKLFDEYVSKIITTLTTNPHTRPFDLLAHKFNFFSAWVPSPEKGCTFLSEVYPREMVSGHRRGRNLELPRPPATPLPDSLGLPELIFTVGPPNLRHDPPGSPAGTDASGRVHNWQTLYGPVPTEARTADSYDTWLSRNDRTLVNERNTAFHIAIGYRPRIDRASMPSIDISAHPLRLHDDDLDKFLLHLRDDKGTPLSDEEMSPWAEGGKDEAMIVLLCRTNRNAGANVIRGTTGTTARYLCITLDDLSTVDYDERTDGNGCDLVPDPVPKDVGLGAWGTIAHELAHPFTLDDEYGGRVGVLSAKDLKDVKASNNVQERAALENASQQLVPKDVKWRWPRLHQAGVLADPSDDESAVRPVPGSTDRFLLTMAKGHGKAFADPEVDIVKLRKPHLTPKPKYSDRLRVVDVQGDQLTVVLVAGSQLDPTDFGGGDLVVAPVRGPDPDLQNDQLGDDLELMHKVVFDRINDTHNPLNAEADAAHNRACGAEPKTPTPASNFAPGTRPARPKLSYRLVGLYEGGHVLNCGVYHPTGQCMMNETTTFDAASKKRSITPFCSVCRYALVDEIDPHAHGVIDDEFYWDYPQ
ncbi:M64 family metallopeptidase [Rhizocola hellebori]|nr:M64 family metallopeptidase [Rhizocola hellebori]